MIGSTNSSSSTSKKCARTSKAALVIQNGRRASEKPERHAVKRDLLRSVGHQRRSFITRLIAGCFRLTRSRLWRAREPRIGSNGRFWPRASEFACAASRQLSGANPRGRQPPDPFRNCGDMPFRLCRAFWKAPNRATRYRCPGGAVALTPPVCPIASAALVDLAAALLTKRSCTGLGVALGLPG
jgi:hypothetical protein